MTDSASFINMTLNYLLHFTFMYFQWYRNDVMKRQWWQTTNRMIITFSIHKKKFFSLCFVHNYSHMYSSRYHWFVREFKSSISIEGQVNRTQQDYNLLGQRVVCQYTYIYVYWLWITVWSEVQIGVFNG